MGSDLPVVAPPVDPGNDPRYVKYVTDVEVSIFETLIRSLAHGKLEIHRNFPKRESLKDCMERTIPYFLTTIVPNSIKPGKNVLIASSEYVDRYCYDDNLLDGEGAQSLMLLLLRVVVAVEMRFVAC